MTVAPSGSSTTPALGCPGPGVSASHTYTPGASSSNTSAPYARTLGAVTESDRWRVKPHTKIDLAGIATDTTEGAPGGKDETKEATTVLLERLAGLQARLWAEHRRSLLVVLQAMDAAGKDGTVKHVFTGVNPMGVRAVAFKAPSQADLDHDFLWRIQRELPERGDIGIFNRSHYEDVLIVRVEELVPESVWRPRYATIRAFEDHLTEEGTTIVKLFLHISKEEQAERFKARLKDPTKNWKFSVADVDVRKRWDDYQIAYAEAIHRTSTEGAPWYVIPADRKWYRDFAVATILVETLERMDPQFPEAAPGLDHIKIV
ncbi:MAG: polyphosphate kinase 2 family protein [Acidimicrobiia bacterium]|nr:polyphosphate kinase 2 family protein [Acidimicrobiia bacterium]